jgi:MinD-like ATPase involved in chromosome partitioning or flagellar assembly
MHSRTGPRVLLACADERRARGLVRTLSTAGQTIAERALDAGGLLEIVRAGLSGAGDAGHQVALVDGRLPGLEAGLLEQLAELGVGTVLVADQPRANLGHATVCLAPDAEPGLFAQAIRRASTRAPRSTVRSSAATGEATRGPRAGVLVGVTSPKGGPGKTTLAINLAAALAAGSREGSMVALADLDLRGGNIGMALGLQPQYNLFQVASALAAGRDLRTAVGDELQEVRPGLLALGGLAAPGSMLAEITASLVSRVLGELTRQHGWVIADLGSDASAPASAAHTAGLELADLVLVVAEPNPPGLWNLRLALGDDGRLAICRHKLGIVLNRFHPRHHHAPAQVAAVFPDVPILACVPHEYDRTEDALLHQRPLVEDRHSRAARAIRELADRLGRLVVVAEAASESPAA